MKSFIASVVMITAFCALVYVAVQHQNRQTANDVPAQLAYDTAASLQAGQTPEQLRSNGQIDLAKSLSPFVTIYNDKYESVTSSGVLEGTVPVVPHGVLMYAKEHGENRLTWQPERGVRLATVSVPWQNSEGSGYVLAGRSLKEVERRVDKLQVMVMGTWILTVGLVGLILLFMPKWQAKRKRRK